MIQIQLKRAAVLILGLAALFAVHACAGSNGGAQPGSVYRAKVSPISSNATQYQLKLSRDGARGPGFMRNIPNPEGSLEQWVAGLWSLSISTRDYPPSRIQSKNLKLLAAGRAKYWEETGRGILTDTGDIEYQMTPSSDPTWGTWKATGENTLEIDLDLPQK